MAYVDPWEGFNKGTDTLISTLSGLSESDYKRKLQDLQMQKMNMELDAARKKAADEEAQRVALRAAYAPKTETVTSENPAYPEYQSKVAGLTSAWEKQRDALAATAAPGLAEGVPAAEGYQPPPTPAQPPLDLSSLGPEPAKTLSTTREVAPHPLTAQIEAGKILMSKGNPLGQSMLQAAQKSIHDEMATLVSVGDVDSAAKLYSDISGTTVTPLGKNDRYEFLKTDQGVVAIDRRKLRQTGDLNSSWQLLGGTGKQLAGWVDLGAQKIGRQEVLVQQNKITGEKKYTKMAPDVVVSGARMEMPVPVIDTANDNAVTFATRNEINANPGRFLPSTGATTQKSLDKQNLLSDIKDNVTDAKNILATMPEFSAKQAVQISLALSHSDGALKSAALQQVNKMLTPEQQAYVIKLNQLAENSMAMRTVLGMGQGSKDVRDAIKATLPSAKSPSKEYAAQQLTALETTLGRLERGVPKVPLRGQKQVQLDAATAKQYLQKAGGDKAKARELAKADGWSF